jgi:UDP-3-O-[3-hydroxymyristoyl] N-acetylglucosamine deacetylase
LALVGLPLLARVEARKAGHSLHTQLVSRLLADPAAWEITTEEHTPASSRHNPEFASPVSAAD